MTEHVFIVGAPRSGAGLLHTLWRLDPRWSSSPLSGKAVIDDLPGLAAADRDFVSHRLTAADLSEDVRAVLLDAQSGRAGDGSDAAGVVDWNPRLSMRIPLLAAAYPEARFVFVMRDVRSAVASGMQAWRSGRFVTVPDLPQWWGEKWSFPLVPGWRDLIGAPLAEVVAAQTVGIAETVRDDLATLAPGRWAVTTYEAMLDQPEVELERVSAAIGVTWDAPIPDDLPLSPYVVSPPDDRKWAKQAGEILPALVQHEEALGRLRAFRDEHVPFTPETPATLVPVAPARVVRPSAGTPFASTHSTSLVELLDKARASVLITTYKSGHAIIARSDGDKLDTAFRGYNRPMGVAVAGSRLAIGTADAIVSYADHPALAARLDVSGATDEPPKRTHDAVFAPRAVTFTGDIAIHEMAYDKDGDLWFVNTRFSCLCRQDLNSSFVPVWRPTWVSALAAEDRCHLNGLAMVDGAPRYVSALSQTDDAHGWREHKGTSGVIVDITTNDVVTGGLSMPHSPRVHDGRLWILQSGKGVLSVVDRSTGAVTDVATLPGFTRGLAFIGRYALVGLSQVRESVFKDLPVTSTATERNAGVWVVDTVTGGIVGLLRFDGIVQEIFDVQVLPGAVWPQIVDSGELTQNAFVLPPDALAQVRT